MMKVEQNMMCALLRGLLDKKVIRQDVHDAAKKQILGTFDWPDFFCYAEDARKENADGDS